VSKLRVGVIGVGSISNVHINAYIKNPEVELCAFCDINEKQLQKRGEEYNIKNLYTSLDEMLEKENLDAVSVCTWNSQHAPCTIKALDAGVHVLCEKPMAMNTKEAEEMVEAAKRNNKLLMIGFVRRHGNDTTILKTFIDNGDFGEIYYAKANYLRRNGNPGGWFGDKSRSGGGPLIDLGVHVIDHVRYACGNPKPVSVYGATFHKLGNRPHIIAKKSYRSLTEGDVICDVEDLAAAMIRFDNGLVLSVEASFSLNIKEPVGKIELFGTKAGACISPELEIFTEQNNYLTNISFDSPTALSFDGLFDNEINHFVDCIVNGSKCIAPAEDGVVIMKILDAIYKSAEEGKEVTID